MGEIEPPPRPALTKMLGSLQTLHHALIGIGTRIIHKRIHLQR